MTQPHSALQEALAAVPDQPDPQTDSTTNPHPAHLDHVATLDDSINQSPTRHRQKVHRHLRSHTQSKTRAVKSLATAKDGQQLPQTTERADRWSWLGWLLLGTTLTSSWVYRRLR
ncbi:hypothetical protein LAC03_09430 [Levilactobacillus acidifarinae]|nr:hypothetical protein LAC03_09430 [Levilactobacillus acidifarinae]